jgi:hypothetical protein
VSNLLDDCHAMGFGRLSLFDGFGIVSLSGSGIGFAFRCRFSESFALGCKALSVDDFLVLNSGLLRLCLLTELRPR